MKDAFDIILDAVPATEPADFGEFCRGLGSEKPESGKEWSMLFRNIETLEDDGLIEVSRSHGRIDTLQLTDAGFAKVRSRSRPAR